MAGDTIKQHRDNRNALVLALADGPLTAPGASRRTGIKQGTAKRTLDKLVGEGVATAWWEPEARAPLYGLPRDRPEGAFDSLDDAVADSVRRHGPGTAAEIAARLGGLDPQRVRGAGTRMEAEGLLATWWSAQAATIYGLPEQKPADAVTNSTEAVIAAVSREPMTSEEIAAHTGLAAQTVKRHAEALRRSGRITRKASRYTLPTNGRERRPSEEARTEREVDRLLRLYDRQAEALRKTQQELEDAGIYVELSGRAVLRDRVDAEA